MTQTYKKKLIEVAIPLEAINAASAREKSIRHGHPSTLHLWWARRPLAACRAVLFAQLVDDPSSHPDKFPTEEAIEAERKRLFAIIEELVVWENSTNEEVLERARVEIRKSCDGELPPVYDPFSGGGSIPLEAQRLGIPAYGSDLNPVAVMIGKAMIEIPLKFKDGRPIHSGISERSFYKNAEGLAEDVKYYGEWLRQRAMEKAGNLYPQVRLPKEYGGGTATAVAYLWSRTVKSPNPALKGMKIPLFKSSWISKKKKKEAWVDVIWDKNNLEYSFAVEREGLPKLDGTVGKTAVTCSLTGESIPLDYVRKEGVKGRLGNKLMALVCEMPGGKIFIAPDDDQENMALMAPEDDNASDIPIEHWSGCTNCVVYGFDTFKSLYSKRQLAALATFSDLIPALHKQVTEDALNGGFSSDPNNLEDGGMGAKAYADAVAIYAAIAVDRLADRCSMASGWDSSHNKIRNTFARHAIPMVWEFAEVNPFSDSTGNWSSCINWIYKFLNATVPYSEGSIIQENAAAKEKKIPSFVLSTDPPYYDNIPYSNLSDYFYLWLRRNLNGIMPRLFSTLSVPKSDELVANRFRHGGKANAEEFFLGGIRETFLTMAHDGKKDFPITIYYAFKQSEVVQEGVSSTGWATFLQAVIDSGYCIVGTWPMRTELANRMRSIGSNALANSVVLVCRTRSEIITTATRSEFIRALKKELPSAISDLQAANVSPADMPQSAIGPGMGIFTRYEKVLEADDTLMSVKTALQLINAELDEFLNDLHGDFDADTRFTASWFEQHGYGGGDYGSANSLATARGIAVEGVKHAGIIESSAGKVRILKRDELNPNWDPTADSHLTIWECCQYLVREYESGGETAAAILMKKMGYDRAEAVKDLTYYLYDICSNKRQDAKEATSYNALIAGWNDITRTADSIHDTDTMRQASLF